MFKSLLLIPVLCVSNYSTNTNVNVQKPNHEEKIVFENCSNLFISPLSNDIDKDEKYSLTIKLDYPNALPSDFEDDDEKEQEYDRLRDYYSKNNEQLVKNIDTSSFENVYVSKYSPFISIDTTYDELSSNSFNGLLTLTQDDSVASIFVNKSDDVVPNLYNAYETIGAFSYTISNPTYTGQNVTIGILEPSIPDINHENFVGRDIEVRDKPNYKETVHDHTTIMASIFIGPYGIVKDSSIKCVELDGDAVEEIDWLLDKGVNIINCSYGDANPTGIYTSKSAYVDFIAYTYNVMFVAAAGNGEGGNMYVANPGLAFNAITVGAMDPYRFNVCDFSSYMLDDFLRKPDVVAPGFSVNIRPFGAKDGTSVSCAITSGMIAMMMQKYPIYKSHVLMAKAALFVSCVNSSVRPVGSDFDDKSGAGLIHFDNFIKNIKNVTKADFASIPSRKSTLTYNCEVGDIIRVVTICNAMADGNPLFTYSSNYDLFLYQEEGNIIHQQTTNIDNKELLEYKVTKAGTYRVDVRCVSNIIEYPQYCAFTGHVTKAGEEL